MLVSSLSWVNEEKAFIIHSKFYKGSIIIRVIGISELTNVVYKALPNYYFQV